MKYYFKCPKCGNDEGFVKPSEENMNLGCLFLLFGQLFPALLFAHYTSGRIQCRKCFHVFRQPPLPVSPRSSFANGIIAAALLPVLAAFIFSFSPKMDSDLPSIYGLGWLEQTFAAEPRLAAYLVASILILVIGVCFISGVASNIRYRKELSKTLHLNPPKAEELIPSGRPGSKHSEGESSESEGA
jgi:hypothetical protein